MLIVIFVNAYKDRFTPALKMEADEIDRLHREKGTPVYLFEEGHQGSQVLSNLIDGSKVMGDYPAWRRFCDDASNLVDPNAPARAVAVAAPAVAAPAAAPYHPQVRTCEGVGGSGVG